MRAGKDPYVVLGVPRGAGDAQIHAAYRSAVRRTHPDAGGSSGAFEDVQEAYEELIALDGRYASLLAHDATREPLH